METWDIAGHCLEFIEESHTYICDGIVLPSITQILKVKFGNKYNNVNKAVLQRASEKGTEVHEAIERYCKEGIESDLIELQNFKFLQKQYGFGVEQNEVPVILFKDDEPIACGRLDLVLNDGYLFGLADIKRTATLDKNYLAYQLNLYRIAYEQCYKIKSAFLKGIHLRDNTRKYVDIPINESIAWEVVEEYLKENG